MRKTRKTIVSIAIALGVVFASLPAALACGPYGQSAAVEAQLAESDLREAIAAVVLAYSNADPDAISAATERYNVAVEWLAFSEDQAAAEARLAKR
jgi:hypothetical protein